MNWKCMCVTASAQCNTWVRVSGWNIIAASTSWKMPALISRILPPPPSSAGVPITSTRPRRRSSDSASAIPAPAEADALTLAPHPCPGGGGRDQVVATTVAEPTERVVFGEEGNRRAGSVAARRDEGGRGVGDANLDAETVLLEQLGEPSDGLPLFVSDLGIGVDVAANPLELWPQGVDPGADRILELTGRRLS